MRCTPIQIVRPLESIAGRGLPRDALELDARERVCGARDTAPTPSLFAEIVSDDFPVFHWPPRLIIKAGVSFYSHHIALGATKSTMSTSIRNRLPGTIEKIVSDKVVSELVIRTAAGKVTSIITTGSVQRMNLKEGDNVFAIIKATEVSIEKE
jgi:molybdopterin-binding protein